MFGRTFALHLLANKKGGSGATYDVSARVLENTAESVIIDPTAKKIGHHAFYMRDNIKSIVLHEGIEMIEASAFATTGITSITLPNSLSVLSLMAFGSCSYLESVTFKGTPKSIAMNAFTNCSALTTINVPWAEGAVANAPWGATNATINYNYTGE